MAVLRDGERSPRRGDEEERLGHPPEEGREDHRAQRAAVARDHEAHGRPNAAPGLTDLLAVG